MTSIGFLVFPDMLQLDFTSAYGVLAAGPDVKTHTIWKNAEPVRSSDGLAFAAEYTFATCPSLDVLVVPGGGGIADVMNDDTVLDFIRSQAKRVAWIASVCTGALVLGAAGILQGKKAATHWLSCDLLPLFGAEPAEQRVAVDGNCITAAGVTSGIDMALLLAGRLWGDEVAESIQLNMEYAPEPPYTAGSPDTAPQHIVTKMREQSAARQAARRVAALAAAKKLL